MCRRSDARARAQSLPTLTSDCWLRPVLLCQCSREVRRYGAQLATALAAASEARALRIAELVAAMLDALPADAGEGGVELLELLASLAPTSERRLFLVVRGIVPRLVQCVSRAVACVAQRERDGDSAGVGDGATLVLLVRQLTTFAALNGVRERLKGANALALVLDNYLALRGLVLQKTPHTDEAAAALLSLLNSLAEGEPESLMAGATRARCFVAALLDRLSVCLFARSFVRQPVLRRWRGRRLISAPPRSCSSS